MKVIAINGSPRTDGNTALALSLMADELKKADIETEIVHVGGAVGKNIRGCMACMSCFSSDGNRCIIADDMLNEASDKIRAAEGLILASPTYYAGISGTLKSFLDRLFFSSSAYFKYKVGTSISVVRRAGAVDVVHQLNNYLQLAEMILSPTQYWPIVYGNEKREILQDAEGVQTIQKDAQSMGWLLHVINGTGVPKPQATSRKWTNFVR